MFDHYKSVPKKHEPRLVFFYAWIVLGIDPEHFLSDQLAVFLG